MPTQVLQRVHENVYYKNAHEFWIFEQQLETIGSLVTLIWRKRSLHKRYNFVKYKVTYTMRPLVYHCCRIQMTTEWSQPWCEGSYPLKSLKELAASQSAAASENTSLQKNMGKRNITHFR